MAYDIYTNIPGPNIDTSLFVNAASRGIAAGNALPTKTTAIIQGALKGFEQGLDFRTQMQEQEVRQNQIEQLPTTNAIQEQQLQNAELANQLNTLKVDIASRTHELSIEDEIAKLTNEKGKLQQETALRNRLVDFNKTFQESDPLKQKQMIESGQYNDIFAANPNTYSQAITTVFPYLNQQEKAAASLNLKRANINNYHDKQALNNIKDLETAQLAAEDALGQLGVNEKVNLPPDQIPLKVEVVPLGKYITDDNGNITGQNDIYTPSSNAADLKIGNQIVAKDVDNATLKQIRTYKNKYNWVNDVYRNRALGQVGRAFNDTQKAISGATPQPQPRTQAPQEFTGFAPETTEEVSTTLEEGKVTPNIEAVKSIRKVPIVTKNRNINVTNNPKMYQAIQESLGLVESDYKPIMSTVKNLLTEASSKPEDSYNKYSQSQLIKLNEAKDQIGKYTSGLQFEKSPELQKTFTPEMVDLHNKIVDEFNYFIKDPMAEGFGMAAYLANNYKGITLDQLVKVSSPKDLYSIKQQGFYNEMLDQIVANVRSQISASEKALAKFGSRSSTFSSILNNG